MLCCACDVPAIAINAAATKTENLRKGNFSDCIRNDFELDIEC